MLKIAVPTCGLCPPLRLRSRLLNAAREMSIVSDVAETVGAARQAGYEPVADVVDYEDVYRLAYLRGPEGLIVEVAEALHANH